MQETNSLKRKYDKCNKYVCVCVCHKYTDAIKHVRQHAHNSSGNSKHERKPKTNQDKQQQKQQQRLWGIGLPVRSVKFVKSVNLSLVLFGVFSGARTDSYIYSYGFLRIRTDSYGFVEIHTDSYGFVRIRKNS